MKRPPGIWILLSAGVLWLSFQNVYGIRATALIFARSTTSTTTPGPVANVTDGIASESEAVTEISGSNNNATKPPLTGNPQLDYVHDPNLPKELNGYNLSDYPFYERVPDPDEIDFKCDGLHDGFYASIPYKCQVYHHCLFGTRYDFLCANYTAFDQKTFICQFVSDVDCLGSKKFWHRNDALYQAATTTTSKPLSIYTTAPPIEDGGGGNGNNNRRPGGKRRRPAPRRPIQYDYYDEYEDDYDYERPRSRRRRPRPRPRPVYEDDEEYEDEDYEYNRRNRRPSYNSRRGSSNRRNKNGNGNGNRDSEERSKKKNVEPETDEDYDAPPVPPKRHQENERKKVKTEDDYDEEIPPPPPPPPRKRNKGGEKRKPPKPIEDDYEEVSRPSTRRKTTRKPQPLPEDDEEDYDYDVPPPPKRHHRNKRPETTEIDSDKPIIKPTTGTIYDRPRVAPRIKPPVPKNAADKYAYKPINKSNKRKPQQDDDYYDDNYEDAAPSSISSSTTSTTPAASTLKSKGKRIESNEKSERKQPTFRRTTSTTSTEATRSLDQEDNEFTLTKQQQLLQNRNNKPRNRGRNTERGTTPTTTSTTSTTTSTTTKKPNLPNLESEYYDDEDYEIEKESGFRSTTEAPRKKWKPAPTASTTSTTSTTTENYKEQQIVRIVKRPFLPSRGGNPYSSRNLQPVGFKAAKSPEIMEQQSSLSPKFNEPISEQDDDFKPIKKPHQVPIHIHRTPQNDEFSGPRTTQKPKLPDLNQIIDENEYDVTLNDALNPNLPPQTLPAPVSIRNYNNNNPNVYNPATDYTFSAFQQRQRYVLEPVVSSANTDYNISPPQRQRFEAVQQPVSYSTRHHQPPHPSNEYKYYNSPIAKRGLTQAYFTPGYRHFR